ncbi:MAG: hypothetical protein U1F87_12695 [Kiritimatiellia bacterium]
MKVRSSVNRLRNLNYFSYVNAFPEDTTAWRRPRWSTSRRTTSAAS